MKFIKYWQFTVRNAKVMNTSRVFKLSFVAIGFDSLFNGRED